MKFVKLPYLPSDVESGKNQKDLMTDLWYKNKEQRKEFNQQEQRVVMKNIVIFGAPGSGKGTQSDLLIKNYGLGHISTGDVLREEIKKGSELGKTAQGFIDNGQLIPDELMVSILAKVYDGFGPAHKGVIFDGFPRTIPQAEALKQMLAERNHRVAAMIELDVPEDELMKRLLLPSRNAWWSITRRLSRSLSGTSRKDCITTSTAWENLTASSATSAL